MSPVIAGAILALLWAWFVNRDPMMVLCTIFTSVIVIAMFGLSGCGGGDPVEPEPQREFEIRRNLPSGGQVQP